MISLSFSQFEFDLGGNVVQGYPCDIKLSIEGGLGKFSGGGKHLNNFIVCLFVSLFNVYNNLF